jgi:sensor c-di-GMP phosphodiesterase-like protein
MPVDAVKVDRMFTSAVGTDSVHARMLDKICGIISTVNGVVLFEGVETEEQAFALGELAPSATAQGWLFGKPAEGSVPLEIW